MSDWDEATLDALSTLSLADTQEAAVAWGEDAPADAKSLLDAQQPAEDQ